MVKTSKKWNFCYFWAIFRIFFWFFGHSDPRLYKLLIWDFFAKISKYVKIYILDCLPPTPPNQKDLSSQWLRHQKNDTFVTFWPFFALLGIFNFLVILILGYIGDWFWDFFFAKILKSVKIDLFDCLPTLTKRIWVPIG